jgi:hypothetical protein
MVVLKKTSSLLLADGVNPEGVTLCARARLAIAAMSIDEVKSMVSLANVVLTGRQCEVEAVYRT